MKKTNPTLEALLYALVACGEEFGEPDQAVDLGQWPAMAAELLARGGEIVAWDGWLHVRLTLPDSFDVAAGTGQKVPEDRKG